MLTFTNREQQLVHNLAVLETVQQQASNVPNPSDPLAKAKVRDAWLLLCEAQEIEKRAVQKVIKGE